jgi:hypothetical protein
MYVLTIRSIFFFLQHTRQEPVYVWVAFLLWSIFICSVLAVFALEYDHLPHTLEPSITQDRPTIDYLYIVAAGLRRALLAVSLTGLLSTPKARPNQTDLGGEHRGRG